MRSRKTPPINRRIRPNLRIIVNLHKPQLRNLHMLPLFHLIPKPIRPHHSSRVENHPVPNQTPLPHINPRMKNTSLSNFDLPSHVSPRPNLRPIPDLRSLFNHRIRPYPNIPPELCQRRDHRSGMNPPQWWRCGWCKKCRNLAKGSRWIGYPNLIFSQIFGSL